MEHIGEGIYLQKNGENKRIAICTVITESKDHYYTSDYAHSVSFGTWSKELYAKKHGYDFYIAKEKLTTFRGHDQTRDLEAAWSKLPLVHCLLDEYDWVFWTDADSLILDFDIQLESFLDEEYDLIACESLSTIDLINTGHVFYKNTPFTKELILNAWLDHNELTKGSYEQRRINRYIKNNGYENHVKMHPPIDFNLSPNDHHNWEEVFIVHMHGYHGVALKKIFRKYKTKYYRRLQFIEDQLR